jgi:hypothetical protein
MKKYLIYLPFLLVILLFATPYKKANAKCTTNCTSCNYSTCHLEAGQYLIPKGPFSYPSNKCISYPFIGNRCSMVPQRDSNIYNANGDLAGICTESLCNSTVPLQNTCGIVSD